MHRYYEDGQVIADEVVSQIYETMAELEKLQVSNSGFGNPFGICSSGARASMPGMMDTILNLGLNDAAVQGLAKLTNNERFAYDSYRRFIQMFSDVVMEIDKGKFDAIFDAVKEENNVESDTDLTAENLKEVVKRYKELYKGEMGEEFPQDPKVQLLEAVKAVFRSWENPRAIVYRRMNDIPSSWGTAVNVQAMVFGNMGDDSVPALPLPAILPPVKTIVRRISYECPGRRRGCRHSHPQSHISAAETNPRYIINLWILQRSWKTTTGTCRTWSLPLKRQALYASDP